MYQVENPFDTNEPNAKDVHDGDAVVGVLKFALADPP
jgi:hypothetical protein